MVSQLPLNKVLVGAILLIAGCCMVLSHPATVNDDELMQNDDYDYDSDDQTGPSQQNKPSSFPKAANRSVSVTGILGQNIVLKCDEKINKNNVILWYQGDKIISNGNNLVLPNFNLDPKTFDLTILKASPQSAGDYYCEVLPQKSFLHTKVIVAEHSMDAIAPESSTSGQSQVNLSPFALMWLLSAGWLLHHFKH